MTHNLSGFPSRLGLPQKDYTQDVPIPVVHTCQPAELIIPITLRPAGEDRIVIGIELWWAIAIQVLDADGIAQPVAGVVGGVVVLVDDPGLRIAIPVRPPEVVLRIVSSNLLFPPFGPAVYRS